MAFASLSDWAANAYIKRMSGDDIASFAFLGLMGLVIAASYFVSQRKNIGRMAQQASIWGLIFVGVVAAYGMWGDIQGDVIGRQSVGDGGQISVPRRGDGHYYLTLKINGQPVNFVVDTGATQMVLTQADAKRVGLDPDDLRYFGQANTANGVVRTAQVRLDEVVLGPIVDRNVTAVVNGGEMEGSLLGMSYLGAFESLEIRSNELVLTR